MTIGSPPVSLTVTQGQNATFTARAVGAGPRTLQWQRDGVDIPGASTPFQMSSITLSNVILEDNGARFRLVASNPNGTGTSDEAILRVLQDSDPPVVVSAASIDGTAITVCFNEQLAPLQPDDQFNWEVDGAFGVQSTALRPDGKSVTVIPLSPVGPQFTVTAHYQRDRFGNEIPEPGSSATGTNFGLTAIDVGTLNPAGSSAACDSNTLQLTGGGLDVTGAADSLRFVYKTVTGDFDARVRVTSLVGVPDHLESTAKALLLARESTAANAANVNVYVTPRAPADNSAGSQIRATTGGTAAALGTTFVGNTIPNGWLRISRSGNVFATSRSVNGVDWNNFSTTSNLTSLSVEVGLGVVSHRNGRSVTGTFTDFRIVFPPRITTQPANQTVVCHGNATFTVVATAAGTLGYQWRRNGTPISGATSDTLTINDVTPANNGERYDVVVSNADGSTTSTLATLTVNDNVAPAITCPANITTPCTGANGAVVTFSASATDNCDSTPIISCVPPSGSTFSIGTTNVQCTANDSSGNRNSCTFSVTVTDGPAPRLTISQQADQIIIRWPETCRRYTLEEVANLSTPIQWGPSGAPVQSQGGQNIATLANDGSTRFFRLHSP